MNLKKLIGDRGENLIAKQYRRNGYKIIARNFSCRLGELDIVAQKGNTVAVVEVKTRRNDDFAKAAEFVDYKKQNRIRNTAMLFMQENNLMDCNIRFDVAEVYTENKSINIIEAAF